MERYPSVGDVTVWSPSPPWLANGLVVTRHCGVGTLDGEELACTHRAAIGGEHADEPWGVDGGVGFRFVASG